jgi:hypothetical protein
MKLPNGERAIIDERKLREYCLNPHHLRGRNKARVFASVGIGQAETEMLRFALLSAARDEEALPNGTNPYGQRSDFDLVWQDKAVRIRSAWIVRFREDSPRLTSCFEL